MATLAVLPCAPSAPQSWPPWSQDDEFVIIGSQAILDQFPDAPAPLLLSPEADLYPHHPDRATEIDGADAAELADKRMLASRTTRPPTPGACHSIPGVMRSVV